MAYVFRKKGSSKWWVGFTDSAGVPCQEPTVARSKTEAREIAGELQRKAYRVKKGLDPELGSDKTFETRAKEWMAQLPKGYRSRGTVETYLRLRILPFLGKRPCRSITRDDVRSMLRANEDERKAMDRSGRSMLLRSASAGTLERLRGIVHVIFEWLIDDLEVVGSRNPAGGKRMHIKVPKRLPRVVPLAELVAILKEIPECYRLLFIFAVAAGARKGELIPLLWTDMKLEDRYVLISKSRDWDTTKGRKERILPIPKWLLPILEAERARAEGRYVFPHPDDPSKRLRFDTKLGKVMRLAAKRAGLVSAYRHICRRSTCGERLEAPSPQPGKCHKCGFTWWVEPIPKEYRFKDLRSTFATLAASDQEGGIRYVQLVLGHQSVNTTEGHYVRALTTDLLRKTDALTVFGGLASAVSELTGPAAETHRNGASAIETVAHEAKSN